MRATQAVTVLVCLASVAFGQGSLTPPGAPAPTMKTLSEIDGSIASVSNAVSAIQGEVRIDVATLAGNSSNHHIISEPGSYYLSRNLAVSRTYGIYVGAADVTIDLNGFKISRTSGSGGYGIRISNTSGMDRTTIRNGSIVGFQNGIYSNSQGALLEQLAVSKCTKYGIRVGSLSRIIDCHAHDNVGSGIYGGSGSSLSGCTASYNQGDSGIYAGRGSSLSSCAAYNNQGNYGIYVRNGSSLSGCTASYNQGNYGIYADRGAVLRGCTAYNNTGIGTFSYGIYANNGSSVIECVVRANSNTNSSSTASQGIGISVGYGGLVKDCTASSNLGDGIYVHSDCSVIGNNCDSNGYNGDGAGIHATSNDNRIDGNTVTGNDRGIDVDVGNNFIVRNTASGNTTNWTVAAGNACLVVYRTGCTVISGNSGGTAPGSTDPNANFTY